MLVFLTKKTIIFIDEVQKYKEMITKIKFFVEEGSFRYVLSGSLLGVELTNLDFTQYETKDKRLLLTKNQNLNAGGIYENAIAQELYSKGFQLYYYNSNRLGELDFVIEYNNHTLPIEVKSGKDYTIHSAMNNCLENPEYQMQEGFAFANCNVSQKGKVTYLPIYMVMFLQKDSEQIVLDKIEF